ncbi:MAG: DUF177 domain-containing protein [Chloroflexi bacterium]|nr:DUF177 domain-containing protein [Chloroflexota bacterium]
MDLWNTVTVGGSPLEGFLYMLFNVAQLLKAPIGTVRQFHVDEEFDKYSDINFVSPIRGTVTLLRVNYGVLVKARLEADVRLECSRCLEEFDQTIAFPFEERFVPTVDIDTGLLVHDPIEDQDDEDVFEIDKFHHIDLHEAVRQHALLRLPLQPLHDDNCLGLCPSCGSNRNWGQCHCEDQMEPDARWRTLGKLLGGYS